ncbi:hypothetical protein SKAU_G00140460 [Synaphobranchus kaupii]|uniref:Uncharacterized protein n=1 Tax=Synaphobranchus kaupii TaxID=118154 RepID=A0A9Q1FS55_SYNKA|nr:hypothetical protein SKAU_G00140460 [Synaphobranchus kaupii]
MWDKEVQLADGSAFHDAYSVNSAKWQTTTHLSAATTCPPRESAPASARPRPESRFKPAEMSVGMGSRTQSWRLRTISTEPLARCHAERTTGAPQTPNAPGTQ